MINIRLEAYKIIVKVLSKNLFSDKLLQQMTKRLQVANENADLLYALVKGIIKMQNNLEYIASLYADTNKFTATSKKIKIILYMGLYQLLYCDSIPEYAAVHETVSLAKKLYGNKIGNFVNAILRAYLRSPQINYPANINERLALEYSFSIEIINKWVEYWGEDKTEMLCIYYNDVPKLHIRINNMATSKSHLMQYFDRRNIKTIPSEASENILISDQPREILNEIAFSEGYYSIQDTSAALVVELLNPELDENILDLFAAPGGKATYISEFMANTGEVIAVDKFPNKIKKLKQAVERLQIKNMKLNAEDAFHFGPVAAAYDKVLLDVPCSGWGVFQKKSELRWQFNQDMPKLLKLQSDALKLGTSFVKPGGFMIYSTCTLNKAENELQIEKFLAKNRDFKLIPASEFIKKEYTENGYLKTLPFKHDMDGAFAAKLQKNG